MSRLIVCIEYQGCEENSDLALFLSSQRGFSNACVWDEDDFYLDVLDNSSSLVATINRAFSA